MKNNINSDKLKFILENHWNIHAEKVISAPRGFVAETYFVKSKNQDYFVKIIDAKSRYLENISESLPVL